MMKLTPPQPEQAPQAQQVTPIAVYLTDEQFNKFLNGMLATLNTELIKAVVKEEIKQEKACAPYVNKTDFSKWSGYSQSAIKKFIKNGLPVAQVGTIKAIGKETFKQFMKEHEQLEEV